MHPPTLVLLAGPVGAGKSSTAVVLAAHLRAGGRPAAVIDLDVVYGMARQREGFDDEQIWTLARRSAAALAEQFFDGGIAVTVIEGGFYTPTERNDVLDALRAEVRVIPVTLHVSFNGVLRRVQADPDPGRVASRNPTVLRWLHDQYERALPYLRANSAVVDADTASMAEVVAHLAPLCDAVSSETLSRPYRRTLQNAPESPWRGIMGKGRASYRLLATDASGRPFCALGGVFFRRRLEVR